MQGRFISPLLSQVTRQLPQALNTALNSAFALRKAQELACCRRSSFFSRAIRHHDSFPEPNPEHVGEWKGGQRGEIKRWALLSTSLGGWVPALSRLHRSPACLSKVLPDLKWELRWRPYVAQPRPPITSHYLFSMLDSNHG